LTDLDSQTIICKTSGCSGVKSSRRAKRSPYAIENIVREINIYLKLYQITNVFLISRMRINSFFRFLSKELEYHGINIDLLRVRRRIAFNGTRGRKLRRR
jgi:ribosomal protein S11